MPGEAVKSLALRAVLFFLKRCVRKKQIGRIMHKMAYPTFYSVAPKKEVTPSMVPIS